MVAVVATKSSSERSANICVWTSSIPDQMLMFWTPDKAAPSALAASSCCRICASICLRASASIRVSAGAPGSRRVDASRPEAWNILSIRPWRSFGISLLP